MTLTSMQFSNITLGKLDFTIFVVLFSSTLGADRDSSSPVTQADTAEIKRAMDDFTSTLKGVQKQPNCKER